MLPGSHDRHAPATVGGLPPPIAEFRLDVGSAGNPEFVTANRFSMRGSHLRTIRSGAGRAPRQTGRSFVMLARGGAAAILMTQATVARAQSSGAVELARAVNNPVAELISVPIQAGYDRGLGREREGSRWAVNIQPVVPFTLSEDWNVVSRTIVPLVSQNEIFPGAGVQSGVGDIIQSAFFTPRRIVPGGLIWGAGPVILLPSGSDVNLGLRKWGAGPTAVVLKQDHAWSLGLFGNHLWSFAGDRNRPDLNQTLVQPFVAYTNSHAYSFGVNSESLYNWERREWTVPIGVSVSKVTKFGDQSVSLSCDLRYWLRSPDGGPKGVGAQISVAFLFPR